MVATQKEYEKCHNYAEFHVPTKDGRYPPPTSFHQNVAQALIDRTSTFSGFSSYARCKDERSWAGLRLGRYGGESGSRSIVPGASPFFFFFFFFGVGRTGDVRPTRFVLSYRADQKKSVDPAIDC